MSFPDRSAKTGESTREDKRRVEQTAAVLREAVDDVPSLGIVLPSDLEVPARFSADVEWSGDELPHWPGTETASVLAIGLLAGTRIVLIPEAPALHERNDPRDVVFPTRVVARAGVETLLFGTTAASVEPQIDRGDLVLTADHVNFQGANPLVGPNVDAWGPRFPDMTAPYAASLRQSAQAVALREGLRVHEGVYFAVLGPDRGTRAERRMARTLGADVVGTETVQSVIAARHMGVEVLSVSVVTVDAHPIDSAEGAPYSQNELPQGVQPRLHTLLARIVSSVKSKEKSEE
jgi:purine-nucleoside phosphorylase